VKNYLCFSCYFVEVVEVSSPYDEDVYVRWHGSRFAAITRGPRTADVSLGDARYLVEQVGEYGEGPIGDGQHVGERSAEQRVGDPAPLADGLAY
jgi:hypothetical protein